MPHGRSKPERHSDPIKHILISRLTRATIRIRSPQRWPTSRHYASDFEKSLSPMPYDGLPALAQFGPLSSPGSSAI